MTNQECPGTAQKKISSKGILEALKNRFSAPYTQREHLCTLLRETTDEDDFILQASSYTFLLYKQTRFGIRG